MLGSSERELAEKFGVDVYSENPHLQELLRKMARARFGGKGVAAVGTFFLPVSGLVSATMTASNVNSAADQLVNSNDRTDLFRANKIALSALGFPEEEIVQFLNLVYFSPREATYFRFYLERLKDVAGFQNLLKVAGRAKSAWEARKILYELEIAVRQMEQEKLQYAKIVSSEEGLIAEIGDRSILITPYDYLDASPVGEKVLRRMSEIKGFRKEGAFEIWNAGRIARDFSLLTTMRGLKTREWLLVS